ncbi:hypothetical protein [Psychroserpens sp.]|uniref:hypothetical protein n=1 Tax=Psychroserpens sp. TaxID=2020870 RepID=UPI002B27715E|nr:hypothetical protein [Psychroserpens sp.]
MRKLIYILCFGFLFTTCDDGDIVEVTLDFEDEFKQCGSLVFFKTNASTSESLSIQFGSLTIEDILEVDENFLYEDTLPLGGSNVLNYRSYANLPADNLLFCNDIPPSNIGIERDEVSIGGEVFIRTVLVEDDNDGIPSILEDLNGNGDLEDDDFDNDGIPNYLDADDDGDNVLTITELTDFDNNDDDGDPLTNPEDTDGDGNPNYLDTDDDDDGVLTRDEDLNSNLNPTDDNTNTPTDGSIDLVDYLDNTTANPVIATEFRPHIIRMIYTITATVSNISLPSITQQTLEFGTLNDSSITNDERLGEPVFID